MQQEGSLFSTPSPAFIVCRPFNDGHSDWCEARSHYRFDFHFSNKEPLDESEKVGLKLNTQKTKIMASGPITLWQIDGETVETAAAFIFLGSKITEDGDSSHEIKRRLLLGRKVMANLDSIIKRQRHYFTNTGPSSQGYGFYSSHVWI